MQNKIIVGIVLGVMCGIASAKTVYLKPHEYRMRVATPISIKIKGEYYHAFKNVFYSNNHYCFTEKKVNYCVNADSLQDYANE